MANLPDNECPAKDPYSALQKAAAKWILKTRELHRIPLSVIDAAIQDVEDLFQTSFALVKENLIKKMKQLALSESVVTTVARELHAATSHMRIFDGLRSQHQQQVYFSRHFNLVVSH